MALRTRGETVAEYAAAAAVMRAKCLRVRAPEGAIDIVGTGGDGKGTLNISTAAAFVVAGAGVPVAKHGNRNLSSKSGAADALTELGINVMVGPEVVERALAEAGIGFMMAPMHHPAMRHVMPARTELGTRTIFNILGPLTNPASVRRQLTGAYRPRGDPADGRDPRPSSAPTAPGSCTAPTAPTRSRSPARPTSPSSTTARCASSPSTPRTPACAPHPLAAVLGGTPADNARALRGLLAGEASRLPRRGAPQRRRRARRRRQRRRPRARASRCAAESIDSGAARAHAPTRSPRSPTPRRPRR